MTKHASLGPYPSYEEDLEESGQENTSTRSLEEQPLHLGPNSNKNSKIISFQRTRHRMHGINSNALFKEEV